MNLIIIYFLSCFVAKVTSTAIECDTDESCLDKSKCINQFCQCPAGLIFNEDGTKCIKLAATVTASCQIDAQCALINGPVFCKEGRCLCADGYVYLKKKCIKRLRNNGGCSNNDQCFDGLDYHSRVCKKETCQCAEGYYDRAGFDCRKKLKIGETCALSLDCKDKGAICDNKLCSFSTQTFSHLSNFTTIEKPYLVDLENYLYNVILNDPCHPGESCKDPHAVCSPVSRTCQCRSGYFLKAIAGKKTCISELGNACTNKSECGSTSICENGVCSCAVGNHYSAHNQLCRVTAHQIGNDLHCNNDESCRMLGSHYVCNKVDKFCRCEKGYKINNDFMCEVSCLYDTDCNTHEICDATYNQCVCAPEYESVGNACMPKIGGECSKEVGCTVVENSVCDKKTGLCKCEAKYVPYKYDCYKEVNVDDVCLINEQCIHKWNSSCMPVSAIQNRCRCDKGFVNVKGNCLRIATKIGDYCTHPAVCMQDTLCEKSKCTCIRGLKPSKDKSKCLENTSHRFSSFTYQYLCLAVFNFFLIVSFKKI